MSDRDASALARQHTNNAIATLAEIMDDQFAEDKDRIKAAESLLDRGHGKAVAAVIEVPAHKARAALLAQMTTDELMAIINGTQLPRMQAKALPAPKVIDAEFKPVDSRRDPLLD